MKTKKFLFYACIILGIILYINSLYFLSKVNLLEILETKTLIGIYLFHVGCSLFFFAVGILAGEILSRKEDNDIYINENENSE